MTKETRDKKELDYVHKHRIMIVDFNLYICVI